MAKAAPIVPLPLANARDRKAWERAAQKSLHQLDGITARFERSVLGTGVLIGGEGKGWRLLAGDIPLLEAADVDARGSQAGR
jgi:hypothetical protein